MVALAPVPLFGSGVYGKSAVVTRQRRVNCYYETRPDGDKSKVVVYGTPGLVPVMTIGTAGQAVRGILGPTNTLLFAVTYNLFEQLGAPLTVGGPAQVLSSNGIGSFGGLVSMASNPSVSQIMMVDGSQGYLYFVATQTLVTLAAAPWFVAGAKTCTNVGGYFVSEIPGTGEFAVSNINDASTGNGQSFASNAAYPDIMAAVDNLAGNLLLFGQRHLEFWQPVGTPPPAQPFGLVQSSPVLIGLAAVFSRATINVNGTDSMLFLGQSSAGTKSVYLIQGYSVTAIGDEISYILNQPGFVTADATALVYQRDKHPFYQITFPSMGRSFLFDLSTNIPGEVQTGVSIGPYVRHTGNISTYFNGDTVIADYATNIVYRMDDNTYTDNGVTVLREVITKHQTQGLNRFRIPQLYLDMETGVGTVSGQGVAPVISIECSKDNGRTWLQARLVPMGALGQYIVRVNARRFGMSRVFTFRFRLTDPVKFVITDGYIKRKGGKK
jgi:hypothetical protein